MFKVRECFSLRAHRGKKGKKVQQVYVEWDESYAGQWGNERFQWVLLNQLQPKDQDDIKANHKELGKVCHVCNTFILIKLLTPMFRVNKNYSDAMKI